MIGCKHLEDCAATVFLKTGEGLIQSDLGKTQLFSGFPNFSENLLLSLAPVLLVFAVLSDLSVLSVLGPSPSYFAIS